MRGNRDPRELAQDQDVGHELTRLGSGKAFGSADAKAEDLATGLTSLGERHLNEQIEGVEVLRQPRRGRIDVGAPDALDVELHGSPHAA